MSRFNSEQLSIDGRLFQDSAIRILCLHGCMFANTNGVDPLLICKDITTKQKKCYNFCGYLPCHLVALFCRGLE